MYCAADASCEKTADKLLRHFGSVKKVRAANVTDVAEVVGLNAAKKIKGYFDVKE